MRKVIPGKALLLGAGLVFALLFKASVAEAYIYGEGESSTSLLVDKKVKSTSVAEWQDNIPASQKSFQENDVLEFQISVKNTGDEKLKNINVKDILPSYLKIVFNPGEWSEENQEISWEIDQLNPDEEKSFNIRTQVKSIDQSSVDNSFCLINKAEAKAESGEYDQDTASFCLISAEKLPKAGSGTEDVLIGSLVASLIALTGVGLRKFGRGEILA